jgi:WD40 repeat protein
MVFLDGLSQNLLRYDLTTQRITSTVVVPSTSGPLGIRPVATGAEHEVWTANAGTQVTVSDLATQSVVTNIPTPSLPQAGAPAGIVFSPDGTTAFEAVGFLSPDTSGNLGALAVFDAAGRKVTSTLLLKNAPSAILIAPDGYTVYLLSSNGMLTYYDVLSGTADLSVSTYTPGLAGGYPGSSAQVFLTPDGTHLYWNVNYLVVGFDLTTRKISSSVNSGLSSSSQSTMYMAQDGLHIWLTSADGTVAVYDVPSGGVIATITADPLSAILIGPGN